jgi:hypothetical protein
MYSFIEQFIFKRQLSFRLIQKNYIVMLAIAIRLSDKLTIRRIVVSAINLYRLEFLFELQLKISLLI